MANTIQSSNMLLPIPVPGTDPGPDYAYNLNSCLTLVDSHDHTPGKGVQLTTASLNINGNLPFNGFFATQVAGVTFNAQSSAPANGTIYESGVDLFYVDGVGNNIQITSGGGVVGTPGSITNLAAPASVTYVAASRTFVFASDSTISANLDAASLIMRNTSPNSTFALTLTPPASLAANYTITLPQLPVQKNFVTMDTSGNLAADSNADNVSLQYTSNLLSIKPSGVGTASIANGAVTAAKLDVSAISVVKRQLITSSGSFVVPVGMNTLQVLAIGGGAGGGSGTYNTSIGSAGGGGGGGRLQYQMLLVTPGETLTLTVGGAGAGGVYPGVSVAGVAGGDGGATTIQRGSVILMNAAGGSGGGGGVVGGAGGIGGPSFSATAASIYAASGGAGGATNVGGAAGMTTIYAVNPSSSGGTGGFGNGGGGGGGGGINLTAQAPGGNGGNNQSSAAANNGSDAPTGNFGAGGGGASGGAASGPIPSPHGGAGQPGCIIISYTALP